jgi:UDP-N-acetylglucosamine 1-carboxyvinyltransferase
VIEGVKKLHGAEIKIIPDSEESASLITLAAATRSDVTVAKTNPEFLEDYLLKIRKMGVKFEVGENYVRVFNTKDEYKATKIQCGFYPKLNSDYIPPMSVLATQAVGESMLFEWLYENRLGYVPELVRMGAKAEVLDPHRVKIIGPTPLKGQKITSFDLRMGMTLVIASLVAQGESEISEIQHVDRGYERLEERLRNLGADIKRVE